MYRYACFKPPRNRVRRASGFVLTGDPDSVRLAIKQNVVCWSVHFTRPSETVEDRREAAQFGKSPSETIAACEQV